MCPNSLERTAKKEKSYEVWCDMLFHMCEVVSFVSSSVSKSVNI